MKRRAEPPFLEGKREGGISTCGTEESESLGRRRYTKAVSISRVWQVVGPHAGRHFRWQWHLKMRITSQVLKDVLGMKITSDTANHLLPSGAVLAKA